MQVTIIGSGNIATVMGRVLKKKGHVVRQVYSRTPEQAAALAQELGAVAVSETGSIDNGADLYLFAVTDAALPEVASRLSLPGKLLVHAAGSVSKEVLSAAGESYGVVWPMKMIRKTMTELESVTLVIDANNERVLQQVNAFASLFSNDIMVAGDEKRLKMHLLASFMLNFANHLYHLAAEASEKEGIDFSVFQPMLQEAVQRLAHDHPRNLQAGPAFRGDTQTMQKHLSLLENHPQAHKIYQVMSESIQQVFKNGLRT